MHISWRKKGIAKHKPKSKKCVEVEKKEEPVMPRNKPLLDDLGVIRKAVKILPDVRHKVAFLEALDELENHECHRTQIFPKTELTRLRGITPAVYHGYIIKTSGWRFHATLTDAQQVRLADVLTGDEHDDFFKVVRTRRQRYR